MKYKLAITLYDNVFTKEFEVPAELLSDDPSINKERVLKAALEILDNDLYLEIEEVKE